MKISPEELALALEEKRPEMLRIAAARLRYHGLEADAEDIVQDAIVNLLEYTEPIRPEELAGLFHTTCAGLLYNWIGRAKRHDKLNDEYTTVYQVDSQAHIKQRERLNIDVSLALDKLDPPTREIVRLAWMEDKSHLQIKRLLRISGETVAAALAQALPILRLELARYDHRARPASVPPGERLGVSASQAPYKEESGETDSDTALWAAMPGDAVDEMLAA